MKKIISCFLCLIVLSGCSKNEQTSIGIIKTSSYDRDSEIILFDEELNEINRKECESSELGSNFIQPSYQDKYVYFVPRGLIGKYDDKKIIEFNLNENVINEYKVDKINLQGVAVSEDSLYSISNYEGVSYLTQVNKKDGRVINEVTSNDNIMDLVVYASDKVCLFEYETNKSYLKIYDKNLKLLETKEITDLGSQHSKYAVYENKVVFSNPYIFDKENNTISILDLENYEIKTIELNHPFPSDIVVENNEIIVSHTNDVDPNGNNISIVDLSNYSIKEYSIDQPILRMEVLKDNVYILSPNVDGKSNLSVYDLKNNFKKMKSVQLSLDKNYYYSSLFINKIHWEK